MPDVNTWVLAVDVGGTWTRFAAMARGGRIISRARGRTGSEGSQADVRAIWRSLLADVRRHLPAEYGPQPRAVGIGATGPIDHETGRTYTPPNTGSGLADLDLIAEFRGLTGSPVSVERDTNAALLAEHSDGAGQGSDELVYLTVSTGVGGAALSRGRLLRGRGGGAVEVGHVVVERGGPLCGCGRRGCLEAIASGPALAAAAARRATEAGASALRALADVGTGFTGASVDSAARAGDPVARSIIANAGDAVVSAVVDIANLFDPDLIILGGSVAAAHPEWIEDARVAAATSALEPTRGTVRLAAAALGDDGVLIGAGLLAWGAVSAA